LYNLNIIFKILKNLRKAKEMFNKLIEIIDGEN